MSAATQCSGAAVTAGPTSEVKVILDAKIGTSVKEKRSTFYVHLSLMICDI